MSANETHFKGDKAKYTGVSETVYGRRCFEIIVLEGRRKYDRVWTYREPSTACYSCGYPMPADLRPCDGCKQHLCSTCDPMVDNELSLCTGCACG